MRTFGPALLLLLRLTLAPSEVLAQDDLRTAPGTVHVPRDARTIQEAIDMVADGGTVHIAPGAYIESVEIVGKRVNLIGGDRTRRDRTLIVDVTPREVVPLADARGLVEYGPAGGGSLANLTLVGRDAAVLGRSTDGRTLPSEVRLRNVSMLRNGRGVTGSFSQLVVQETLISGSLWHGFSACARLLELSGMTIVNATQLGLLVFACQDSQSVAINNATIAGNLSGGAAFFGDVAVSITNSLVTGNRVFGVLLVHTPAQAVLVNTTISGTVEGVHPFISLLGDGLVAMGTGLISMIASNFVGNQRIGVALVDAPTHGTFVNTVVSGNRFGRVGQGGAMFTELGSGNVFTGNTEQDFVTDGSLPVPEAPPIPEG